MAKLTNYFKVITPRIGTTTMTDNQNIGDQGAYANYTWYQRLIQGSASRITRYREYDLMDNDVEVSRALDTIAEEMCGSDPQRDLPLVLKFESDKSNENNHAIVNTLKTAMQYWSDLHELDIRLFKIARMTIKYGDCFFLRKSPTKKWEFIHPRNVIAAIVDENDMTKVLGWQVKQDIKKPNSPYSAPTGHFGNYSESQVDTYSADEIVWFSLNDDISEAAPFGDSILRAVYRAQKQKELLEDAIIIYRIQRAPERRVFYIDVGKMPPARVKAYLEQIKNDMRQKKVPTAGGGVEQVDSVYNPQSMNEDFFFAQRPDGKGSRVEVLPGGQGLGELADLEYFQWKVFRGLRIPLSYMREGQDNAIFNDGKVGVAYIQELRFALFIKRLQRHIEKILDAEFKKYLRSADVIVDNSLFKITLPEPENFGVYRQQELNANLLATLSNADNVEYISKRFALRKYAGFTDEEILTNETMRAEELGVLGELTKKDLSKIYNTANQLMPDVGMGGDMIAEPGGIEQPTGVGELGSAPPEAEPTTPLT
jgi:hypothetical protein